MARTDIAGLLTGISSQRPDPMSMGGNAAQQRLAFGAQRAQGLQRAARGLMGQDTRTPSEQLQMAMANLDMSNPDDLRKIAQIQQATGDLAGAAQTAARIQAMKQAVVTEERAERKMEITEETFAMKRAATDRELDRQDALLAQQGISRALFANQARDNGNENLAVAIETGSISLEKAAPLLYGSSNAIIKPPTKDEKKAFDRILESGGFKDKIEGLKERQWLVGPLGLSDESKEAIYYKAKTLMARQKMSPEDALERAVEDLKTLDIPMDEDDAESADKTERDKKKTRKENRSQRPVDKMLQDDSPFGTITEMNN